MLRPLSYFFYFFFLCMNNGRAQLSYVPASMTDTSFSQEYHVPHFPNGLNDADIRNIAVDDQSQIWIATSEGIFKKQINAAMWEKILSGLEDGPMRYCTILHQVYGPEHGKVFFNTGIIHLKKWQTHKGLFLFCAPTGRVYMLLARKTAGFAIHQDQ